MAGGEGGVGIGVAEEGEEADGDGAWLPWLPDESGGGWDVDAVVEKFPMELEEIAWARMRVPNPVGTFLEVAVGEGEEEEEGYLVEEEEKMMMMEVAAMEEKVVALVAGVAEEMESFFAWETLLILIGT